jgi:transposase-like protein
MEENEAVEDVVQPTRRRRHSREFKEKVIRAAMQRNEWACSPARLSAKSPALDIVM